MIEEVISSVIENMRSSSNDVSEGFFVDVDHFLEQCQALQSVQFEPSSDPRSLVVAIAEVDSSVESIQDLTYALKEVWGAIAYLHFEATSIQWFKEATVLRFVTVISDENYYVTGTIRVAGPHYPLLVQRFERDFGDMHGPLPSLLPH
jgi:hypothetical protein